MSSYNTAGLISEVPNEVATQVTKNCLRQKPHSHLMPRQEELPANIRIHLIFPETRALACIFFADSMGLSSFKFGQWAPKDTSFLQQSVFWPFKVIQGWWFWYQSKAHLRLPISPPLWLVLSFTVSDVRRLIG